MTAKVPVLPITGATVLGTAFALVALATHWLKRLVRAHRHRREARVLAGLDQRMLADIGITRADVDDAFSQPFWEDPTMLLSERAGVRRHRRRSVARPQVVSEAGGRRPPLNRPARQAI